MSENQPTGALRPRKTPKQTRAEETVATIVEAAAQVLESAGVEGFNTNAVAERAGVSIGSLYQYFPNKDALIVALIQRESQRFRRDLAYALGRRTTKGALEGMIIASVRQQLQRPMLARLLDVMETRPELRGEVSDEELKDLFAEIVSRLVLPDHVRIDVVVGDLFAIIRGMVDAAGERGERDIASLEHRLRAAVLGYIARVGKRRM